MLRQQGRNAKLKEAIEKGVGLRFGAPSSLPVRIPEQAKVLATSVSAPMDRTSRFLKLQAHRVGLSKKDRRAGELRHEKELELSKAILAGAPTAKQCVRIIWQFPDLLGQVPEALRSQRVCETAVERSKQTLEIFLQVPEAMRNRRICYLVLERSKGALEVFSHVPLEALSERMCLRAIELNPRTLQLIPAEMRTTQMEMQAISAEPSLKDLATRPGVLEAFNMGWSLQGLLAMPKKERTLTACLNALLVAADASSRVRILDIAPPDVRSLIVSGRAALSAAAKAIPEMRSHVLRLSSGRALKYMADVSDEELNQLVGVNGGLLFAIPSERMTVDLCARALRRSPDIAERLERRHGIEYFQQVVGRMAMLSEDRKVLDGDGFDVDRAHLAETPWEPDEDESMEVVEEDVVDRPAG